MDHESEFYVLNGRSVDIVASATMLLWKIVRCPIVNAGQVEAIARGIQVLEKLPDRIDNLDQIISLCTSA